ncbi:MAG: hypothetical protein Q9181_003670 [Wetmoreana brouardii]
MLIAVALAKCECGYAVKDEGIYTDAFEADFLHQSNIGNDDNWEISGYSIPFQPYTMQYEKGNVIPNPLNASSPAGGDPGLQLVVRGPTPQGSPVRTAELITKRTDMHYGSYRTAIKYTREPGTCGSMFWWKNATKEIDIELLSYEDIASSPTSPIHFVLHAKNLNPNKTPQVPFHPSDGYHEYRFDWSPGKVSFYTDGKHVADITQGVPEVPGRILLNHWSHGDPGWTRGPPVRDATMTVAYVKAYFNVSSEGSPSKSRCVDPSAKDAICQVPDQSGPISPDQDTVFLTTSTGNTPQPSNPVTTPPATTNKVSPDATCGAVMDGVVPHQRIAAKAASQRLAAVILVLPTGDVI